MGWAAGGGGGAGSSFATGAGSVFAAFCAQPQPTRPSATTPINKTKQNFPFIMPPHIKIVAKGVGREYEYVAVEPKPGVGDRRIKARLQPH